MVDNQLRDNDPPAAKEAYQKLLDAGYSMREAKEKIGAVALTEIYDVMKEKQSYDEKRSTNALAEMVQQSIDFEDRLLRTIIFSLHISAKVVYLNGRKKNVEFKIKKTNIRCGR